MAIMLVDDMLDQDPRGAYHRIGHAKTANLAVALFSLGVDIVLSSDSLATTDVAAILNRMTLRTAFGQSLDVENYQTEEGYWKVAKAKSSPYFGTALALGALFGGADSGKSEVMMQFGEIYGEIMQIHDDLNDCLATPANVDWLQGRSPLPLLFAQLVPHPDRARFVELRSLVEDPNALDEAQQILVRSGAISYCVNELMLRHANARSMLDRMQLVDSQPLLTLLDEAIAPVNHLLDKVGATWGQRDKLGCSG
jgi:geranylgeranyl diphosphate synthase type I